MCFADRDSPGLRISGKFSAFEMVGNEPVKGDKNNLYMKIPTGRTQVIQIKELGIGRK